MHKIRLLVLLAAASAAAPAMAQPAQPAAKGARTAAPAHPNIEQRIDQIHRRLRIAPEQETAWNNFAQVMRDNADKDEQAYRQHAAGVATMSALDNLRMFAGIEQQRAQELQALLAAFETLYAGLSDDQKHTADAIFRRQGERLERRGQPKK